MPLSWNEIRQRAITFSREWSVAEKENAEAHTFWDDFFKVFGKSRRAVASFEESVKSLKGSAHRIDVFWPGRLIGEHKSRGKDLAKAHTQAMGYVTDLINNNREAETPRYIVTTDFAKIAIHDLEPPEDAEPSDISVEFPLADLHLHIRRFAFIAGYETQKLDPEDPANIKAAELLANLHDRLEEGGYTGHDLQRFMVRILFVLFAEDTGIFEPNAFESYIRQRTAEDGSDLGLHLAQLFQVLNTPEDRRQANLDEDLAELPYVNGELFSENLAFASFNSAMRIALLECCRFKWETISPAVFGSLFQSIMEPKERRQIGAHYTSERDILKLIRSLFLDRLKEELDKAKSKTQLDKFLKKLGTLNFLDPACGCGNFLVIGYRELRRLEMDAIAKRFGDNPDLGDLRASAQMSVDQFYGIEIEEWPALIAEVALWLMDHQLNNELFARFGTANATVPLKKSPHIKCDNALCIDWNDVLPAEECSYIMGNPPFVGGKLMNPSQRAEVKESWNNIKGSGLLDYVTAWYAEAADYIANGQTRIALVSTNSITQGEQVGVLWSELFARGFKIDFAHRTFPWVSEARGKAHVHVVIVGFGRGETDYPKQLFDYGNDGIFTGQVIASNVSPYLTDGPDRAAINRSTSLCQSPEIGIGNKPIDGGYYFFTPEEKRGFLSIEPSSKPYFRRWHGSRELLHSIERWFLWLGMIEPDELKRMPACIDRVEKVRKYRLGEIGSKSNPDKKTISSGTRKIAGTPRSFHVQNIPSQRYLVLPRHYTQKYAYSPFVFADPGNELVGDACLIIDTDQLFDFGVLISEMSQAWIRQIAGRIKSDIRYSAKLVYNNFPWPEATETQQAKVEAAAQAVLDSRENHPGSTLADLYDPLTMPADLAKAHSKLDRAVDRCYRSQPFPDERRRFEHLFGLYEQLTSPLTAEAKIKRTRKKR